MRFLLKKALRRMTILQECPVKKRVILLIQYAPETDPRSTVGLPSRYSVITDQCPTISSCTSIINYGGPSIGFRIFHLLFALSA